MQPCWNGVHWQKDFSSCETWYWQGSQFLYTQVNTNGLISFVSEATFDPPQPFPPNNDSALIAPFWSEVDTRGTGNVFYRQTTNDTELLSKAAYEIQEAFAEFHEFAPTMLFIATWDGVGYYNSQTDLVGNTISIFPVA